MAEPATPLETIRHLLGDATTRRALTDDPSGTLARHGHDGYSDDDVRSLLDHAGDTMPVETATWMQRFGSDEFVEIDPPVGLDPDSIGDLTTLADGEIDAVTVASDDGLVGAGTPPDHSDDEPGVPDDLDELELGRHGDDGLAEPDEPPPPASDFGDEHDLGDDTIDPWADDLGDLDL